MPPDNSLNLSMTFNARFVLNIIQFASKQGADIQILLKLTNHSMEELCSEDLSINSEVYNSVIESAINQTRDPHFGLHLGENLNLSAAGLIYQIAQTSETVLQALNFACEFASLGFQSLPMMLVEEKEYYKLEITPSQLWLNQSEISVRHTLDGVLVFSIKEFHTLTFQKYNPIKIEYQFPNDTVENEYQRLLNCPIKYGCKKTRIYFKKEHLHEKVITSDFNLLGILVKHANEKVRQLSNQKGFTTMVKDSVVNMIRPQFPTIAQVASNLNVSIRTLQRKLTEENTTFKDILEGLRQEFALNYIKNHELSINEIAYLLSYADASSFIRSFKRWTGKTPSKYREG